MLVAIWALAAYVTLHAAFALRQFVHAWMALRLGVGVQSVSLGWGPTLYRCQGQGYQFRLALFPFYSETLFATLDRPVDESLPSESEAPVDQTMLSESETPVTFIPYERASAGARLKILASGLSVNVILGLLLIMAPIQFRAPALVAVPAEESQFDPCAVPGLAVTAEPTTWASQLGLLRDTAAEFMIRLVTFQSLEQWGGYFGFVVTAGVIGAHSGWAWFSAVGVVLLMLGLLDWLPINVGGGWHFICALYQYLFGQELAESIRMAITTLLFVATLVLLIRMYWIDLRWLWHAFVA